MQHPIEDKKYILNIVLGKLDGKKSLNILRHTLENNIKIDLLTLGP
jgi:hypothetical protein